MRSCLVLLCLVLSWGIVNAQDLDDFDLETFTEKMFSVQTSDINYEDLYEQYLQWTMNPLDLNKATDEELRSLYILTNKQITDFFEYRSKYGKLLTITELQVIQGFDEETINNLKPFIRVDSETPRAVPPGIVILESRRLLQNSRGIEEGIYKGDAYRIALRSKFNISRKISLGLTLEKDAGESVQWNPRQGTYGSDFTSFNLHAKDLGPIKTLVVGDFQAQFGQGLVLGSGFFLGKGAETVSTVRRSNLGIRPYTSMVESSFMRGISFTIGNDKVELTPIISLTKEDGRLVEDSTNFAAFASSILTTGFHRTQNELDSKGTLERFVAGMNLTYNIAPNARVGITSTYTELNTDLQPTPRFDNRFHFRGSNNNLVGIFGSYNWQNLSLFAEGARSKSGGYGLIAGGIFSLSRELDFSWSIRKYERDFHSLYGSMFSEASNASGEQGVYLGLSYRPIAKIQVNAYWDRFNYPWMRYQVFGPSEGNEGLVRVSYNHTKKSRIYAQIRRESKMQNLQLTTPTRKLGTGIKTNYLLNSDYPVTSWLTFKTRVQFSTFSFENDVTEGIAFMQDFTARLNQLTISGRVAIFDTDDYENRQYSYEKDILYNFSIPAYSGQGLRTMLLLKYKASRSLSFWIRAAQTTYNNVDFIGNGYDRINGNKRTELKLQGRVTF